jgi:hypothetical protein
MGGSWGGGTSWEPLSLSLSPLARGEGIQFDTFLPTLCQKLICARRFGLFRAVSTCFDQKKDIPPTLNCGLFSDRF